MGKRMHATRSKQRKMNTIQSLCSRATGLLLLGIPLSCHSAPTGLRIEIVSTVQRPLLTGVLVKVARRLPGGTQPTELMNFAAPIGVGSGTFDFPLRATVYSANAPPDLVDITAQGFSADAWPQGQPIPSGGGAPQVLARVITDFVRGDIRVVRLLLAQECVSAQCSNGFTCVPIANGGNNCVDATVHSSELPQFVPGNETFDVPTLTPDAVSPDIPTPPFDVPNPLPFDVPTQPGNCSPPTLGMPVTMAAQALMGGRMVSRDILSLERNITADPNSYQLTMGGFGMNGSFVLATTRIRVGMGMGMGTVNLLVQPPLAMSSVQLLPNPLDALAAIPIAPMGMMEPPGMGVIGVSGGMGNLFFAGASAGENSFNMMGANQVVPIFVPPSMTNGMVVQSKSLLSTSFNSGGARNALMCLLEPSSMMGAMPKLRCTIPNPGNPGMPGEYTVSPLNAMNAGAVERLEALAATDRALSFITTSQQGGMPPSRTVSRCEFDLSRLVPNTVQNLGDVPGSVRCDSFQPMADFVPDSFSAVYVSTPFNCVAAPNESGPGWYVSYMQRAGQTILLHAGKLSVNTRSLLELPVIGMFPDTQNSIPATALSIATRTCQMVVASRFGASLNLYQRSLGWNRPGGLTEGLRVPQGAAFRLSSEALNQMGPGQETHILATIREDVGGVDLRAIPTGAPCQ